MKRALIIFLRSPERGKVKTRLARSIGEDAALAVYRRLLAHTRGVATAVDAERHLFYADAVPAADEWPEAQFHKHAQQGEDLGERMLHAFQTLFHQGTGQAIIIGSDCPGITPDLLENAFAGLLTHDVAIGPAADGGYYLLGMRQLHEPLFRAKAWSTAAVFESTMQDIASLGLSCHELPVLTDIDEAADLPAMQHL